MKLLIRIALAGAAAALAAGCSHGQEAAYGASYTDITRTSTERGAYGVGRPYVVIDESGSGSQKVIDVNVTDMSRADAVAQRVVNDRKGNASSVTVRVFEPDEKPPHAPAKTVRWSAGGGFSETGPER